MKITHWVTFQVPVDASKTTAPEGMPQAQAILDAAWEKLIDPDEEPEGLVEHVADGDTRPEILATNLIEKAA